MRRGAAHVVSKRSQVVVEESAFCNRERWVGRVDFSAGFFQVRIYNGQDAVEFFRFLLRSA